VQNREDARDRLRALLEAALVPPKKRLPARATPASRERRLRSKMLRGEIKRTRHEIPE
jgi:ribosome-associated protein